MSEVSVESYTLQTSSFANFDSIGLRLMKWILGFKEATYHEQSADDDRTSRAVLDLDWFNCRLAVNLILGSQTEPLELQLLLRTLNKLVSCCY